jgi:predicted DCC family thiol-disulfide oxidoreductase YuxK
VSATILFDGVCNLCNGFVQFVIARDPHARFRFAALTSDPAKQLLDASGVRQPLPDSIVLLQDGAVYVQSDAALRIARGLAFPWPLLYGFIAVPRGIRDWIYGSIAAHRYAWFGRRDSCMVPTPGVKQRFLN